MYAILVYDLDILVIVQTPYMNRLYEITFIG